MADDYRDRADDSLFTLIGDVPQLVSNLVKAELDSAKRWVKSAGKDAGLGGVWFIVALFFLFWTLPALGAFTVIGLSAWMPLWVAALILVGLGIVLAAICAVLGLLRFRHLLRTENPVKAARTDVRIVKDVTDEF